MTHERHLPNSFITCVPDQTNNRERVFWPGRYTRSKYVQRHLEISHVWGLHVHSTKTDEKVCLSKVCARTKNRLRRYVRLLSQVRSRTKQSYMPLFLFFLHIVPLSLTITAYLRLGSSQYLVAKAFTAPGLAYHYVIS